MDHAFLTQEGVWTTQGKYIDSGGREFPAHGRMRVFHGRGVWSLQSTLTVDYPDRPLEFSNRYDITPLPSGALQTPWVSVNSALGLLHGFVGFVDDTIISEFISDDGFSQGREAMICTQDGVYLDRGFILRKGETLSSWSLTVRPWSGAAG